MGNGLQSAAVTLLAVSVLLTNYSVHLTRQRVKQLEELVQSDSAMMDRLREEDSRREYNKKHPIIAF